MAHPGAADANVEVPEYRYLTAAGGLQDMVLTRS